MTSGGYEDEEYYHGLLPREDLPFLLKNPGDFLVRTSQTKHTEPRSVIISLAQLDAKAKEPTKEGKDPPKEGASTGTSVTMRHYIIMRTKTTPQKWTIDGSIECDSIVELIEEYRTKKQPLNKEQPGTIIINPIKRASWELVHDSVKLGSKLGSGAFGDVYSGKLKLLSGGEVDVAVKVPQAEDMNKDRIKELMKEARLMRNFDHPNVVKLYGVAVEKEPLMIVMELVDGGGLGSYLRKGASGADAISNTLKLSFVMDAAWGIEYLHMKQVIHRDIAVRNCLVSTACTTAKMPVVKISDFGLSREGNFYRMRCPRMVPVKWLAPESITNMSYSQKSDVYSFGVLAWQIFKNGDDPYSDITNADAKKKILEGRHLIFPTDTPSEISSLIIADCWDINPDKRSCMTTLCKKLEVLTSRSPSCQQESLRKKIQIVQKPDKKKNRTQRNSQIKKPRRGKFSDDTIAIKKVGISGKDMNRSGRDKSGRSNQK